MKVKGRLEGHSILKGAEETGEPHAVWILKGMGNPFVIKILLGHLKQFQ